MPIGITVSITESGRSAPSYDLSSDIDGKASLKDFLSFIKQTLIVTADEILSEEQSNGFDKQPLVRVDGSTSKSISQVNPFGKIEFTARQQADTILIDAYQAIIDRSPSDTGLYKENNLVFQNGKLIAENMQQLVDFGKSNPVINDGDIFRFVNVTPYARKLESLGVTGQRQSRRLVRGRHKAKGAAPTIVAANGAYFLASRAISRLYKKNTSISFGFISGGDIGGAGAFPKTSKGGVALRTSYKKGGRGYLYPSIKIVINSEGIL